MVRGALGVAMACMLGAVPALGQGYSVVSDSSGNGSANTGAAATPTNGSTGASDTPTANGANGEPAAGAARVTRRGGGNGDGGGARVARHPWEYGGLTPGGRTVTPGISRRRLSAAQHAGHALVAWPGFQITPQGSRVFVAIAGNVSITSERSAGRLVYHLDRAEVPVRNDRRTLETRAFETPVERAFVRQRGNGVDLVIELRAQVEPQMSQQAAGAQGPNYVFIDFPHWAPPAPATPPEPQTGIRPAAGTSNEGGGSDNQGIRPAAEDTPAGDGGTSGESEQPPPVQP